MCWHVATTWRSVLGMCWHVSTYSWHMWGTLLGELHFSILGHFCMHGPLSYSIKRDGGHISKQVVIVIILSMLMRSYVIAATDF
jgi:hypothetical protein